MNTQIHQFTGPVQIEIIKNRWNVTIKITASHEREFVYIASADSFFTGNDGIWFSDMQEYNDYMNATDIS